MSDETNQSSGYAAAPIKPPTARRSRRVRWIALTLIAAVLVYVASPYYAFWRFTVAVRSGDRDRLATMVDFRALRQSLKDQLKAKIAATRAKDPNAQRLFSGLSDAFAPRLVDTLVDSYVTPEGLAALLSNKLPQTAAAPAAPAPPPDPNAPPAPPAAAPEPLRADWSRVRYAFFTGPRDFLVDVEGTKMRFRFSKMRWQLKEVELQLPDLNL